MANVYKLLIGGDWCDASDGRKGGRQSGDRGRDSRSAVRIDRGLPGSDRRSRAGVSGGWAEPPPNGGVVQKRAGHFI